MTKIVDRWFYFPVVTLGVFLIYLIIKISNTIFNYPLHNFSDNTSYLSQLYFLKEYGYHALVPNWYGGFINLKYYPPLWYFINLPFYKLTNHITLTSFITTILFLIILFIVFSYIGKYSNLSKTKSTFLYLTFLLAPSYYFSLFKMGRFPVLLAYVFFFISFIFLVKYKDKKLDNYFLILSIPYACILLSHPSEFILFSVLLLGLFLQRTNKERLLIVFTGLITLVLSSFWLIPFLDNSNAVISKHTDIFPDIFHQQYNLISIGNILVVLFFISFYFYWKSNQFTKKTLLFYSPVLIYSTLYITTLYRHLPVLRDVYTLTFNSFLVFLSFYLFLNTNFSLFPFKKIILFLIKLLPLLFVIYALILYPTNFIYSAEDHKTIELLNKVDNNFLVLLKEDTGYHYGTYLTIYKNLTTPDGWFQEGAEIDYYLDIQSKMELLMESNDCNLIKSTLKDINVDYILSHKDLCDNFENCNLEMIPPKAGFCLFKRK